ncbi:DNA alkylation repair protein [Rummeliibacillus sp. NPDC094406]|uniref:DNA alkylation repair protein n=1 Tax=Rummeliibacillus sp. NPDC094406 TaxID=3364511 RepID=UPI0038161FBA
MKNFIQERLFEERDLPYRDFNAKLIPTVDKDSMIGVRIPAIRKIAKEVAKEDAPSFLSNTRYQFYEEKMLSGMVIGYAKMDFEEQLTHIEDFIPKIDNWSVCDSFCTGLKSTKKHQKEMWQFIQPYAGSNEEYKARFAAVMLLNYFVNETYIQQTLALLDSIQNGKFYTQMAVAWAISICYIKFPEITEAYLKTSSQDTFTYNKALQKIIESNRIDHGIKDKIRAMKRK